MLVAAALPEDGERQRRLNGGQAAVQEARMLSLPERNSAEGAAQIDGHPLAITAFGAQLRIL
jgi:hypothetical protein